MNTTTSLWTPLQVSLLQPVIQDGVAQRQLSVQMISHAQHREIINASPDDSDAIYQGLICAATGLTPAQLKTLAMPDFNSLLEAVEQAFGDSASDWFTRLGQPVDDPADQLTLLFALPTLEGEVSRLSLTFPTVAAVELMGQQASDQQDLFIKASCTGLGPDELVQLSVPDWKALDARVADFLSQTGSFFSAPPPSKPSSTP